jgi:hypothetical protein
MKMKKTEIKKFLTSFIKDREYLIELTEKRDWQIHATTPWFWIKYCSSNLSEEQIKKVTKFVMADKTGKFSSISDTISDVYNNPVQWIGTPDEPNTYFSFEETYKRCGSP